MGIGKKIKTRIRHILIRNKRVSVISNNCWGGFMYQSCNLQYQSPFIGLFIFAPDYIWLLEHFDEYLLGKTNLRFINKEKSKYSHLIDKDYPIGELEAAECGSVEIHFLHYHTEEECARKWNQRVKRIDKNNMIVKFCDRDLATEALIERFDALPFDCKVCFTSRRFSFASVCYLPEFEGCNEVVDEWEVSDKYWNFIKHCNQLKKV